jgi:carbohydrate kinase (thermoresistant glucokinase family)
MIILLMGVSGCGKTTVGEQLAERLGWPYQEGDALHPPANVAKMAGGTPLSDADRLPWLTAVAAWIDARQAAGESGVVSCSALKRAYRQLLIDDRPEVQLVYLQGSRDQLAERLAARTGHYMPAGLLDSQLATLEEPTGAEQPLVVTIDQPVEAIVVKIMKAVI